jgi:hypothetical protein
MDLIYKKFYLKINILIFLFSFIKIHKKLQADTIDVLKFQIFKELSLMNCLGCSFSSLDESSLHIISLVAIFRCPDDVASIGNVG